MNQNLSGIGSKEIGELAAIGSASAQTLMQQMRQEAREAEAQKEALANARQAEQASERSTRIGVLRAEIEEALESYEALRKQAQAALNKAFEKSFELPFDVQPKRPFDFLKKANLLPAFPGPNDELWPVFSTTEQHIHQIMAGAAHAAKR